MLIVILSNAFRLIVILSNVFMLIVVAPNEGLKSFGGTFRQVLFQN